MDTTGTVVLVVVLLLVLALLAWAWATRGSLLRLRQLATNAAEQAERQRARRDELRAAADAAPDDAAARRALADGQRRLDGDVSFHVAGVRAYNSRLAKSPASLVASVAGLHPLPEPAAAPAAAPPAVAPPARPVAEETRATGATKAEPPRD